MVIGDISRKWEDQRGLPFQGVGGKELDITYLPLAGLRRDDIFCTDLVQCRYTRADADVKPPDSLVAACTANHLSEEIWSVCPEIIILCGASACALAFDSKLEFEHGYPQQINDCPGLFGWSGVVVPMYSVTAGLRDSKFMIPLLEDWERLGDYLRGDWVPPILTKTENKNYFLARTRDCVQDYFQSFGAVEDTGLRILSIDSESDEGRDWSIQVSAEKGSGVMVLLEDKNALNELVMIVSSMVALGWVLVFHHAPADLDLCERIGIDCSIYRDTMAELFIQGNLPQGLKAAVYRTLGARMTSYTDTVVPWSKNKLGDWLAAALDCVVTHYSTSIPHPVGSNCPTCGKKHRKDVSKTKPHEAESVLRRVMKYCDTNPDYDPWLKPKTATNGDESFRLLGQPWLESIEGHIGRMPRASIVHVPIATAIQYAVGDADMTGQLAVWLETERERIVRKEWKVA